MRLKDRNQEEIKKLVKKDPATIEEENRDAVGMSTQTGESRSDMAGTSGSYSE